MYTLVHLIVAAVGILLVLSDNLNDIDVERDAKLTTVIFYCNFFFHFYVQSSFTSKIT